MTADAILRNPTLHPNALQASEHAASFKWHGHAHSPRSSQVFCLSAFGTLRNITAGNRVLAGLLAEAFPEIARPGRPRAWAISPEHEDEMLLNERGVKQPTSVDCLCTSTQEVVCIESKFVSDAAEGFGQCGQAVNGPCAGFYGPGSDLKTGTDAWCRLEGWEGARSPRLYWSLGRSYFRPEVFAQQGRDESCPFVGPNYQLMRNFLFAAAMAERDGRKFFGVLAICPEPTAGKLALQVDRFRNEVLLPRYRDRVRFLTYERLIHHLRMTAEMEALELAGSLEERIDTVCR